MTREEKYVVNPLIKWLKNQKATWEIHKPRYGTAATGWDIEARRKNQDLLIEAKYINGPFLSSFTSLVTAPLANRPQHFTSTKYRSWSYKVCWAIGTSFISRNVYQILLDYIARNPKFWKHYSNDLKVKYVFFIKKGKVAKITFDYLLNIATVYGRKANGKKLNERRAIADTLMENIKFS